MKKHATNEVSGGGFFRWKPPPSGITAGNPQPASLLAGFSEMKKQATNEVSGGGFFRWKPPPS
ncbi:MAG TPA: hypothetical protein P5338_09755, partial [Bacteroidales bacterium]|nr:hypothetical protein [Bacteroidales bacterium]